MGSVQANHDHASTPDQSTFDSASPVEPNAKVRPFSAESQERCGRPSTRKVNDVPIFIQNGTPQPTKQASAFQVEPRPVHVTPTRLDIKRDGIFLYQGDGITLRELWEFDDETSYLWGEDLRPVGTLKPASHRQRRRWSSPLRCSTAGGNGRLLVFAAGRI